MDDAINPDQSTADGGVHDGRLVEVGDLPVLDVGPFLAGEAGARDALAAEIRNACENVGFFFIRNHGVSDELVARTFAEAKRFHDLPMEDKLALAINQDQRGYIRPAATLVKHSTYNKNTKFDSNETMVFATEFPEDDPNRRAGTRFYGPNQWPENLPGFRDNVTAYMDTMTDLGKRMLPAWAAALELAPDFFDPYFEPPFTYFRMGHYPPVPDVGENEFGLGPHADTGFMTFLPQSATDGLEILDVDGNWFRPPRMDDAILVNTGQFLERWTNGRFRATPHRVIPPKDRDRYSIAIFVNNAFEPVCECLPTCHGPDNPPRYAPETYWDYFNWYISRAYPHYDEFHEQE